MHQQRISAPDSRGLPRIAYDAEARELGEVFEAACSKAARLYAERRDTRDADAEVDRLLTLMRAKGIV